MSELDALRELAPPPRVPSLESRLAARERLLAHANRISRRRVAARLVLPSVSVAAASAAAVAVALSIGGSGAGPASAATALREAAAAARVQEPLTLPPGKFLYTASTNAYLSTQSFDGPPFHVLVPHRREIWLDRSYNGWLRQTSGEPRFLSDRDRQTWIAYGRPGLDEGTIDVALTDEYGHQMATLALPSDPERLWEVLSERARGHSSGDAQQLFTLVGDALRENFAAPQLRAALYDVAARIPGVEFVGDVRDAAGRPGTAVALRDEREGTTRMLIFDRDSGHLLGERFVTHGRNHWGYPAGTVVGYAVYSESVIVDRVNERQ